MVTLSCRASQVVSPSELPDSPFEPISADETVTKATESEKVMPNGAQSASDNNNENNNSGNNNTVFNDTSVRYATEGTPAAFSLSTSLSSLHSEDNDGIQSDRDHCEGIKRII